MLKSTSEKETSENSLIAGAFISTVGNLEFHLSLKERHIQKRFCLSVLVFPLVSPSWIQGTFQVKSD